MFNFEAFWLVISSSINLLLLKSELTSVFRFLCGLYTRWEVAKVGVRREKSVIWVARTHFKGKNGGKTMVRGNKPWEKISREKYQNQKPTKHILNLAPIHLKFGKMNSINRQLYLPPKKFWVSDYFEEKTWNYYS